MGVFPPTYEEKVGFRKIRELVVAACVSSMGKERAGVMSFQTRLEPVVEELDRTDEFQRILRFEAEFPTDHYYDVSGPLNRIRVPGSWLELGDLVRLRQLMDAIRLVVQYFQKKDKGKYPGLCAYVEEMKHFPVLVRSIDRVLDKKGVIRDHASPELRRIRQAVRQKEHAVNRRLQAVLKEARDRGFVDKDAEVAIRNGRGVLPVHASGKRQLSGLVHDQSSTGKTVYVEPADVVALHNEINDLRYEEQREIIRILGLLTDEIRPYTEEITENIGFLGMLDFLRAKASVSNRFGAIKPLIKDEPVIRWSGAVHPGLRMALEQEGRQVVPLDIALDSKQRILLISGPNAGGKSVCLQTVGLLQYMLQCGMPVPVQEGSEFGLFQQLFIDIGDEQSIENDLSTYSSHLLNMKYFLKEADTQSLLLIDEFGTGTEPALGGAIAEAILEAFNRCGSLGVMTTHYTNLKHLAAAREGLLNGAMLYDNHKMQPLFRLSIGKPGSSFAFEIARKMGIPEEILQSAAGKMGAEQVDFDKHLKDVLRDKKYWENKRQRIRIRNKKLEELVEQYEKGLETLRSERKEIMEKARREASELLQETNKTIENTIRQIRESQAEKEKTREARRQLEQLKEEAGSEKKRESEVRPAGQPDKHRQRTQQKKKVARETLKKRDLKEGDKVRMEGSEVPGEVMDASGKNIMVAFGNLITTVKPSRLTRISAAEYRRETRHWENESASVNWEMTQRRNRFKPEVDLRGKRAMEAIQVLQDFLDEAVMVQAEHLRILHGKGDGILRQQIREYLKTVEFVARFQDEHVERGGSGITLVDLNLQ